MLFNVVPSTLDGDFDPIAQHFWNVANGFTPRLKDYDTRENDRLNKELIVVINDFVKALNDSDGRDVEISQIVESLEIISNFEGCQICTQTTKWLMRQSLSVITNCCHLLGE